MLKIGIPNRYIDADILGALREHGFELEQRQERKYSLKCAKPKCAVHLLKSTILPELVEEGLLDLAILSSIDFKEINTFAVPLAELDISVGTLMLGIDKNIPIAPLNQLPITHVLTRTPLLTKEFLEKNGLDWKIKPAGGLADSLWPVYGKKYAVVEYVRTGQTMESNGLKPVAQVASSKVMMIAHPNRIYDKDIMGVAKHLSGRQAAKPAKSAPQDVLIYSKPVGRFAQEEGE